jgi:Tfp pilus assembly protein FimT
MFFASCSIAGVMCRRRLQSEAIKAQANAARAEAQSQSQLSGSRLTGREEVAAARAAAQDRRELATAQHEDRKAKEKEMELIRKNYLGTVHQKRRITKASDKFKCDAHCEDHVLCKNT